MNILKLNKSFEIVETISYINMYFISEFSYY